MSQTVYTFVAHSSRHLPPLHLVNTRRCCNTSPPGGPPQASAFATYKVFISHAGEDKTTIAFPLCDKLQQHGTKAFVDEMDMPEGTWAAEAMTTAMETADIAVVVLCPEFVARKWPMRELLCFLKRIEEPHQDGRVLPVIIPLFYRLSIKELYDEPRLDRLDREGKSLYRASRFFERMDHGEPEANIANIKAALQKVHGAMGVENYVNATNDNTKEMSKRRNVLLNDVSDAVREAVSQRPDELSPVIAKSQTKADTFSCHYHDADDVSDLVLKFHRLNGDANADTTEAEVLQSVLDTSNSAHAISIQGIGGVGKSSILNGLLSLDIVRQRFTDGIQFVSLGADATRNSLLEALCKTVRLFGGTETARRMHKEKNWKEVFHIVRSWFSGKECLFMIDDVWETSEISSDVIYELVTLHRSELNSKVLFATRSIQIASEARQCFVLEPREPLGSQCRSILILHSGIDVDKSEADVNSAVCEILNRCGGLPLFLKVAGKAVKALSNRPHLEKSVVYLFYARTLAENMPSLLNNCVDSYERLASTLFVSTQLLEERKDRFGFLVHLSMAKMHRRLSVLPKQSRVPMTMLKYLWELRSEAEAAIVSREFEQIGLASIDVEASQEGYVELLHLHDSLHEYALDEVRKHGEQKLGHTILLDGYGNGLQTEDECRAWWSRKLEVDEYIHKHICRHLLLAGLKDELLRVLLEPEWTIRPLQECGILNLEADFSLGITAVQKMEEKEDDLDLRVESLNDLATALQLVFEAMRLSCGFSIGSPRELCFQLYGRLKIYAEDNVFIEKYLTRLEGKAKKLWGPWMRCLNPFLVTPGGATTRIRHVGSPVMGMTISEDGRFVSCGCRDGRIVVVDLRTGDVVKQWLAYEEGIFATPLVMFSNDSKLVFSSIAHLTSENARMSTVEAWEVKTGTLLKTFDFDKESVKCVTGMGAGQPILTGLSDGSVQVREWKSGHMLLNPFSAHKGEVLCLAMLPGGKSFMSGGQDRKIRFWSSTSYEQKGAVFVGHEDCVTFIAVMPDGRSIVSGSADRSVRIWNIKMPLAKRMQSEKSFRGHSRPVTRVAVSADGRRVVSGSPDTTVRVWDVQSEDKVCNVLKGHMWRVTGVLFHPIDQSVISCSSDGTIRVWDLSRTKTEQSWEQHKGRVTSISFTADGVYVVSGSWDHSMLIWDTTSGQQLGKALLGHSGIVADVAVFRDRRQIVSVSSDKTARVWDFETHELVHTFTGHTGSIISVALTPNGDQAVTSSRDRTIRVWDLSVGDGSHFVLGQYDEDIDPGQIFVSNDGSRVFATCRQAIIVWDLETRKRIKTVRTSSESASRFSAGEAMDIAGVHTHEADTCPISRNGQQIWYGHGEERLLLGTLEARVNCVALSPDKKTLCAGLFNGHVALMKLET